jgi:hypothetical protein
VQLLATGSKPIELKSAVSVLADNEPMLHVFRKLGTEVQTTTDTGIELKMTFQG